MIYERHDLTPDGRVYVDCYIQDWSPMRPFLPKRPAVIICPGGAYVVISEREGEQVALEFLARGYNAFVLHYSIGFYAHIPDPVVDLGKTVLLVRRNSEKWHIDPDKVAVAGFSAGGHLAACLGTMADRDNVHELCNATEEELRPNALILCYAVTYVDTDAQQGLLAFLASGLDWGMVKEKYSPCYWVDEKTPPTFVVAFYDDKLVPVEQAMLYCNAMAEKDRPFELHIFAHGEHGCGSGNEASALGESNVQDPSVEKWIDLCHKWLTDMFDTPKLGTKFASMLESSAGNRAHMGEQVLPTNLLEKSTTRKTEKRRYSLTTRIGDAAADPAAMEILMKYFPEIISSPRLEEFYEMPIQILVLTAAGSMTQEQNMELAKELRRLPVEDN
ncbi:MAG: alpha/beta hydrolase [Ruminococcaceae bacterium]|nr:alpha/beta hydrolase [Oscillospiraceae bacterium]